MIKKTSLYLALIVASLVLGFSTTTFAMTITPVRYEIQGDPGQTVVKEMTIINEESAPVTYYSSFANFEAQGETGSASFVEPKDDIGTWMHTENSVEVGPGEQKTIQFSIDIPQNAEPGGHFGVIFWGNSPEREEDGKQLSVSAKTGLLVLLSVKGDVKEGGGVLDFITKDNKFWYNSLPVSFVYRFKNDGGDRIKPAGKIQIRNTVFLPAKKLDANPMNGNILPASTRKFTVDWINYTEPKDAPVVTGKIKSFFHRALYQWKNFAVGLYSAHLNLTYGTKGETASKTVYFFVFPWQLLICLIVIFTIVFFVGRKIIKQYNSYIIKKAHSYMKMPDSNNNA